MEYQKLDDLKCIKKEYGENMAHLCRSFFSTILETPGLLYYILSTHFAKSKSLYGDITNSHKEYLFKEYIYHFSDIEIEKEETEVKSVKELLDEAGYDLFECKNNEDIQRFKKYYEPSEELCTFKDPHRIDSHYIFFIVKKDVDKIKRDEFKEPKREDTYGVSVLDLQFDKGQVQRVSIKSRYNHTVKNPDATYSNNLDAIILGLTDAFEHDYEFNINKASTLGFELDDYQEARDGKFYKYNYEINNIHYCPDNIILDDGHIIDTYADKSRYTFMDYFILDEKEKKIVVYDKKVEDSFLDDLKNITNIEITNKDGYKEVKLTLDGNRKVIIKLDSRGRIIGYSNKHLEECGDYFLEHNDALEELDLPNLERCGHDFLHYNEAMKKISLPSLKKSKDNFMSYNGLLSEIDLPSLEECGDGFLNYSNVIKELFLPNLKKCGNGFMQGNISLTNINLPNLEECGDSFLCNNEKIVELNLPKLRKCGNRFLCYNEVLTMLNLPLLQTCGHNFLDSNKGIISLNLPELKECGNGFMYANTCMSEMNLPNLEECGDEFLFNNDALTKVSLPSLCKCGDYFLKNNTAIKELDLPELIIVHAGFLDEILTGSILINAFTSKNIGLTYANVPMLKNSRTYESIMRNVEKTNSIKYEDDNIKKNKGEII